MNTSKIKIALITLLCCWGMVAEAQFANATFSVRTSGTYGVRSSDVNCQDGDTEEYTAYVWAKDNVDGSEGSTGCQAVDYNGTLNWMGSITMISARTNTSNLIVSRIDAWEEDSDNRCVWQTPDACRTTTSNQSYDYRVQSGPSNGAYTNGPVWGVTNSHTWAVDATWKYAAGGSAITPALSCNNTGQTVAYSAGSIRSWSVAMTAGTTYRFETCGLTTGDSYIRIYGTDGFTLVAQNNNACGSQDQVTYTPGGSGTYFVEVSQNGRGSLAAAGSLRYYIVDVTAPGISCPGNISVNAAAGTCAATVSYSNPTTSDNCSVTLAQIAGQASGTSFPKGTTTNTFRATDQVGNSSQCSFTVTVNDAQAPAISCPANISVSTAANACTQVVNYTTPSGTDNCAGQSTAQIAGLASGATYPKGTTTNTFRVTDAVGQTATCSFTVTVNDTQAPVVSCPANISVNAAAGTCAQTVSYTTPSGTDNCAGQTTIRTAGLASGASYPVGVTTNVYTVTDAVGLTGSCSFTVTVNDTQAPTISCPGNQTLVTSPGQCTATPTFNNPTFGDNCGGAALSQTGGQASGTAFPKGTTTNTFQVTDASGNTATCTFTITVNDTEAPAIACPSNIVVNTNAGTCTGTASWTAPSGTDNCAGQSTAQTAGLAPGSTTFPKGATTNTYTVTDAAGLTASCSFTVTVNDNEAPAISCPSNVSVGTDAGVCSATVSYATPNGTDNCPGQTTLQLAGQASGTAFPKGTTTNTFQVSDAAGNTAECSFTVTVSDDEAPAIICPAAVTTVTDPGQCAALVGYGTPNGTDNCPGQTTVQTAGQASGTSFPKGTTTNTFVVTDAVGMTAECSFTVTVNDTENPTITCPANVVVGTDDGVCEGVATFDDATFGDNCPGSSLSLTGGLASGSSFPIGTTYNTFTVTDASGNEASCSFTVTVNDDEAPVIGCPAAIVTNTDLGQCGAIVSFVAPEGTDNCAGQTTAQTAGQASGSQFPKGTTTNTFVVTDAAGNTAECSFTVTVDDNEAPAIACPANMTVNTDASQCSAVTTWEAPGVGGGGGTIVTYLTYEEQFYSFNGEVPTTQALNWCSFRSTLAATNTYSTLTIKGSNDMVGLTCTDASVVSQIADALRTATPGSWSCDGHTWAVGTDNCMGAGSPCDGGSGVSLFIDDEGQGECGCPGSGYYVRPEIGVDFYWGGINSDVCFGAGDQSLIVEFSVVNGGGGGSGSGASDNCPGAYVTQTGGLAPGSVFPLGTSSVAYTVTDASGNTANCSFSITVEDHEAPNAVCQDITVMLDATGNGSTTAVAVGGGSNDACGIASLSLSQTDFTCADAGVKTVTLTVIDNNTNASSCDATVTVIDDVDPAAACQNVTVDLDATGNGATSAEAVDNGSSDACGIASLSLSATSFNCSNVGGNAVTLTVTDNNGNTSTCAATVTVRDQVAPVAVCQNVTVQLDATGNGSTTASAVNNGSTDACGIASLSLNNTNFTCANVGGNAVTLTVTDVNGNSSTCSSTVTVRDQVAPVAVCQNVTVSLNSSGTGSTTAAAVNNGSSDACGIASLSLSKTSFNCTNVGGNAVTLTVTDVNGNSSTCSATVTVRDLVAPVAVCQNVTVQLDATGNGGTTAAAVNNGSSDACGIAGLGLSKISFNCSNVGSNTVTLTVIDNNGNSSTCSSTVTVRDQVAPVALCQNVTVQLDATGNGSTTAAAVNNGSTDACGIASLSLSQTSFTCLNVSSSAPTELIISEYIEGSSNNKAIEIYNGTAAAINLGSAGYTLQVFANGSSSGTTITLSGTIAAGGTFVVANNLANASILASANQTSGSISFNGNDAVVLKKGSANIDIFGRIGNDPGSAWTLGGNTTVDKTLRRKSNVIAGVTTNPTGTGAGAFTTLATEWDQFNVDVSTGLGNHTLVLGNTVTLTVTDVNGNSSTCTANVKVEDKVAPTAICQNVTVDLNSAGNGSTTAAAVNNNSTDACGVATLSLSKTSFNCSNVGNNSVTLTVTDVNSNSSTCTANVLVRDLVAPVAVCQPVTVDLNAAGAGSITAAQVNNGSSDACGIASLSLNNTAFGCANVGSGNSVTLTVTDVNGNSNTCTATITVRDLVAPVALCQNLTVQLDATGNGSTTASAVNNSSTDACGIAGLSLSQTAFNCASIVTTAPSELFISEYIEGSSNNKAIEIYNGTGSAINLATAGYNLFISFNGGSTTSTVNLSGTIPAGGTYVVANNASNASILSAANQTSTGLTYNGNDAVALRKGTTNIDIFGRIGNDPGSSWSAGGNQTVDKTLRRKPTVQAGVTVNPTGTGSGAFTTLASEWDQYAVDVTAGLGNHAVISGGNNPVTLTVTDVNGNTSTCSAVVTVEDKVAPVAVCQDITVQLNVDGQQTTTAAAVNNGSSDACGIASLSLSQTYFECANLGGNPVTLTVTDVNGNSSTCSATVTVEDHIAPVAICQDVQVYLDETGFGFTTEQAVNNASTDACGLLPQCPPSAPNVSCLSGLVLSKKNFDCSEVGPNQVLLYVTDLSGNTAVCTSTVTVIDAILPNAICQDVTVQLDATGNGSTTADAVNNGSNDACGIQSISLSQTSFVCAEVGSNNVVLTVTDVNGNVNTCAAVVEVEDNVAPVAVCQDVTIQLDAAGNTATTAAAVNNGSSDACGIASLELSQTAFVCTEVGSNAVTLTVTDVNGNVSTCDANVTVQDNVEPVAVCQDVTVQLDETGNGSTSATAVDNGSNDACGVATLVLSQTDFVCSEVGANTETLTVTDVNGNVSTCAVVVTVEDKVAPVATCQPVTVQLDATGNGTTTASDVNNNSTDACGIASLVLSQTAFVCGEVGDNLETLTVTDVNGNVSTCITTVTVEDNVDPVAICQDVTVQLDATGNGSTTAQDVNNGSNDACGIASLALSQTAFNCSEVGANTETLTVTDVNGNVSTCTTTVTVRDEVAPVAICQNVTVQLDATGNGSTTAVAVDNGSNDACGIASLVLSQTAFVCSEVGANTETLTVTDVNGNVSTCNTTVTVRDEVAPVAICQNVTVQLDATGNGSTTAVAVDNGSNDACGIASLVLSQTDFVCSEVGANTETLTVTDVNGNVSTCTTTVTVRDEVAPVALCQPVTVTLVNGTYTVTASQVNNGSSDACGIASLSVSPNTFTCANIGANNVTLTVTDVNGNVSTCGTVVTVIGSIPSVTISGSTLSQFCQGQQYILTANPTAHATGNNPSGASTAVSYNWTTGGNTQSIDVYASGNYSVTVTNIYGCTASATIPVNYTPTQQLSSYVLLATKHVKLRDYSVVNDGGVGVNYLNGSGKVDVQKNAKVIDAGTFVKSPVINVDATASVTTKVYASAGVTLPAFYTFPTNTLANSAPSVTVKKNTTVTLTGTYYKDVKVEEGATAIFTQSTVVIKKLDVKKGNSTIRFTGCTNVILKDGLQMDEYTQFNPTQQFVTIYSSKEVHIDKGVTFYGNIYSDKHIKTKGGKNAGESINMYGQYIADHIHSDGYTNWNYGTNCGTCTPSIAPVTPPTTDDEDNDGDCDDATNLASTSTTTPSSSYSGSSLSSGSSLRVSSYPNPFSTTADITFTSEVDAEVKVSVLSPAGDEVDMLFNGPVKAKAENKVRFNAGSDKASGIYFYRVQSTTGETEVGKMMLVK